MSVRIRVLAAVLAVSFIGCTAAPTEPPSRQHRAAGKPALNGDSTVTCRSGYSVANGICVPDGS